MMNNDEYNFESSSRRRSRCTNRLVEQFREVLQAGNTNYQQPPEGRAHWNQQKNSAQCVDSDEHDPTAAFAFDEPSCPSAQVNWTVRDLTLLVGLTLAARISRKTLSCVINVIEHFAGRKIGITATEVFKEIDKIRRSYYPETEKFCAICSKVVINSRKACGDPTCPNFSVKPKRSRGIDPIKVTSFRIDRQLEHIIEKNINEITHWHRSIHENAINNDAYQFRASPKFARIIEKSADFQKKIIDLPVSIYFDGVVFKKMKRFEFTPFYIRIESLDPRKKTLPESTCLSTLVDSRSLVKTELYEHIANRILKQFGSMKLKSFCDESGQEWRVRPVISHAISDLKGMRDAVTLPNWQKPHGCHKCEVTSSQRAESTARSFKGMGPIRTTTKMKQQFEQKTFGFGSQLGFNGICLPCNFHLDVFHLLAEGILKDWCKGLFFGESTWPARNAPLSKRRCFEEILRSLSNYTYSNSFVLSMKDFARLTGSEVENLAYIGMRVALANNLYEDEIMHTILLGTCLILDAFYEKDYPLMKKLCALTSAIHEIHHGDYITLKCHLVYYHLPTELMDCNKDGVDTADFEKIHKWLQGGIVDQNCSHQMFEVAARFLCLRETISKIREHSSSNPAASSIVDFETKPLLRFPNVINISSTMAVCSSWKLEFAEIESRCSTFAHLQNPNANYYHRALLLDHPFQSEIFGKGNPISSQMALFTFRKRRNQRGYGKTVFFVEENGKTYIFTEEYSTIQSVHHIDPTRIPRASQSQAKEIIALSRSCATLIAEKTGVFDYRLIPTDDFISPLIEYSFQSKNYICPIRPAPVKR